MLFSENPKVVIVDDNINEVKGLMAAFSKNGIPFIYISSAKGSEPEEPFSTVRLLILDIDLGDKTPVNGDKIKASMLATLIKKIISPTTNPCICMFWTKNDDLIEDVKGYLRDTKIPIQFCSSTNKPSETEMAEMTISDFEEIIKTAASSSSFDYIIEWENSVQKAAAEFVNKISKIAQDNTSSTDWNDSIRNILSKLACSYTGKSKIAPEEKEDALKYATTILNQSFSETLSCNSSISFDLPQKPSISLDSIAKLNSILFIDNIDDCKIENGKVFFERDEPLHKLLRSKILTKNSHNTINTKLISVILTPSCDLAHKRFLVDNFSAEYHRILMGLKILIEDNPFSYFDYTASSEANINRIKKIVSIDNDFTEKINSCLSSNPELKIIVEEEVLDNIKQKIKILNKLRKKILNSISVNKPEYLYVTQPFFDEGNKMSLFVFHFGTIRTRIINPKEIKFSYRMKNSLISDLQTKLANHVNRLGNNMLEYK